MAYENYTDEQLAAIAGVDVNTLQPIKTQVKAAPQKARSIQDYSDEELAKIAGVDVNTLKPIGVKTTQKQTKPDPYRGIKSVFGIEDKNSPINSFLRDAAKAAAQEGIDLTTGAANWANRKGGELTGISGAQLKPYQVFKGSDIPGAEFTGRMLPYFLPILRGGGLATKGAEFAAKKIPGLKALGEAVKNAKGVPGIVGRRALPGMDAYLAGKLISGSLAANNPNNTNEDVSNQSMFGGLLNAGVRGAFGVPGLLMEREVTKLAERAAKPGSDLRTPKEAGEFYNAIDEAPINIGTLVNSPSLENSYKNTYSAMPGSKSGERAEEVVNMANRKGKEALDYFLAGRDPREASDLVQKDVEKIIKDIEDTSSKNYQEIIKGAEEKNITVPERPRLESKITELLKSHEATKGTRDISGLKDHDVELIDYLLHGKEETFLDEVNKRLIYAGKEGMPKDAPKRSLQSAMLTWSALGELSREYATSGNKYLTGVYNKLQKSLEGDIEEAIEQKGGEELFGKWKQARSFFRNEVVPARNSALTKIVESKTEPEKITNVLVKKYFEPILKRLPDESRRNLIFQRAEGKLLRDNVHPEHLENLTVSPSVLGSGYKRLSEAQKNRLTTADERAMLGKLAAIDEAARVPRLISTNPPTGFANRENMIKHGTLGAAGITASHSPLLGFAMALYPHLQGIRGKKMASKKMAKSYINQKVEKNPTADALIKRLANYLSSSK